MRKLCKRTLDVTPVPTSKKQKQRTVTNFEIDRLEAFVLLWQNCMTLRDIAFAFQLCHTSHYLRSNMCSTLCRMYELSHDQVHCLYRVFLKQNVFITGPAGTGKTFIGHIIYAMLTGMDKQVARTASTGVSAINIHGQTVHSFAGIGINETLRTATMARWRDEQNYVFENYLNLDAQILDEVSMLNANQFSLIEAVPRFMRNEHTTPAGGLQMIIFGDFLQLPPVKGEFAFMSPAWTQLNLVPCVLTTPHRQLNTMWYEMLCKLRLGQVNTFIFEQLKQRVTLQPDPNCPRLFSKRVVVDAENEKKLAELTSETTTLYSTTTVFKIVSKTCILPVLDFRGMGGARERETMKGAEQLDQHFKAPHALKLKVGARVMLVDNNAITNPKYRSKVANGSTGEVVGYRNNAVVVQFDDVGNPLSVPRVTWEVTHRGKRETYIRTQYPLMLAWAITIHKAQGLGMTRLRTSLRGSEIFQAGQGYVSLSRARTLEGLDLDAFDIDSIRVDQRCIEFYNNLERQIQK